MTSDRQSAQKDLLEKGERLPGVAEALQLFHRTQESVAALHQQKVAPLTRYSTGGNAS